MGQTIRWPLARLADGGQQRGGVAQAEVRRVVQEVAVAGQQALPQVLRAGRREGALGTGAGRGGGAGQIQSRGPWRHPATRGMDSCPGWSPSTDEPPPNWTKAREEISSSPAFGRAGLKVLAPVGRGSKGGPGTQTLQNSSVPPTGSNLGNVNQCYRPAEIPPNKPPDSELLQLSVNV